MSDEIREVRTPGDAAGVGSGSRQWRLSFGFPRTVRLEALVAPIRDVAHTGGVAATLCSNCTCTRNLVVYEKCAYDMVPLYGSMRVVAYIVTIPLWATLLGTLMGGPNVA